MTTNITIEEKISRLVGEFEGDQHCLWELLLFLGKHPRAHFSRLAIVHALDSYHSNVEKALGYLVAKGVVKADARDFCYSLTNAEPWHSQVMDLVRLYWWKWQLGMSQL